MATKLLVLGDSGSGKTTSTRNLDPKETFILQCVKKELPFKGAKQAYNTENKNLFFCKDIKTCLQALQNINDKTTKKVVIVDDFNYLMSFGYKASANDSGFEKFERLAFGIMDIIEYADQMREDITVIFMAHIQENASGKKSMKTIGKFLDDKIVIEGLFTTVLLAGGAEYGYNFITNGVIPAKSPMEMFEENTVENDLKKIIEIMKKY